MMRHEPFGDHPGISTNELIFVLMKRLDAHDSLFALLGLMVEMADELPINKRCRMACSLRDCADMIEQRALVKT
jgi:hypothetical protein